MKPADSRKSWENAWNVIPPEDLQPYLTLFVFSMRKTLTLHRKNITVGGNKFRDLDLSQLPGGNHLSAHHGTLFAQNGGWSLRVGEGQGRTCLNGYLLTPGEYPLKQGDCVMLNETVLFTIRKFSGYPEGSHLGGITGNGVLAEDVVLWLESEKETVYVAKDRKIVSRDWEIQDNVPTDMDEEILPVKEELSCERDLRDYVRKSSLWIDHNRPNELDDDFEWNDAGFTYQFCAESRQVKTSQSGYFSENSTPAQIITIPEKVFYRQDLEPILNRDMPGHYSLKREIKYRDELQWLVKYHRKKSGLPVIGDDYEDMMYKDVKLQSGKFKVNGQLQTYETVYYAQAHIVNHIRRDENQKIVYYDERTVPLKIKTLSQLTEFVKSKTKNWIN